MSNQDSRIAELLALAAEEGVKLPYPAHYIVWLEDRGRIVELPGGQVYNAVKATPTSSAQAVCRQLAHAEGEVSL